MPVPFDPYQQWLGISRSEQPPTHYRLLGLDPFEPCFELIQTAAEQKTAFLCSQLTGEHSELARRLTVEVAAARTCLSDPAARAAYDEQLGRASAARVATAQVPPAGAAPPPPALSGTVPPYAPPGVDHGPQPEASWLSGIGPAKKALMFVGAFLASFVLVVGLFLWGAASPRQVAREESAPPDKGTTPVAVPPSPEPSGAGAETSTPATVAQPPDTEASATTAPSPQAMFPAPPEPAMPSAPPVSSPVMPETPPGAAPADEPLPPPSPETPPPADARAPTPTSDQQQAVRQQLGEVYDLDRQRTPEEDLKLAEQLMDMARKSLERSAERFVLLREVIDQAGEGGDAALMLDAVDAMGADFDIDVLDFKQMVLNAFAQRASSAGAMQSLIDGTTAAVDHAVGQEDYAAALRLIAPAYAASRRPAGSSYRKEVSDRRDQIEALLAQRQQIDQALSVLESDPDNAEANLAAGRWYGLVKDDWDRALPHLAKGSDSQLQLVAKRELIATADDTDEQIAVGDAWWDLAQTRDGDERAALMRRAGFWYERAHDNVASTLLVAKLDKRLDEIANLDRPESGESGSGLKPGDSLPVLKWVELSDWIEPAGDGVSGKWEKKGREVRVAAASNARLRLPVSVEGNYDLQFGFTRTGGNDAIVVVLPVGKKSCTAVFSGGGGKYSGLEMLANKPAGNNPSTQKPTKLNNGQRYTIQIRVRLLGEMAVLEAAINGMPYLRARGPQDSLDVSRQWAVSPPDQLALGANQSSVTFRNVQLRVVKGGSGKLVAPAKSNP
jgi:hypothetical protein